MGKNLFSIEFCLNWGLTRVCRSRIPLWSVWNPFRSEVDANRSPLRMIKFWSKRGLKVLPPESWRDRKWYKIQSPYQQPLARRPEIKPIRACERIQGHFFISNNTTYRQNSIAALTMLDHRNTSCPKPANNNFYKLSSSQLMLRLSHPQPTSGKYK